MSKIADDTRGGFNTFLMEQREEEGEAAVTLYDFDSTVELVYRGQKSPMPKRWTPIITARVARPLYTTLSHERLMKLTTTSRLRTSRMLLSWC
jgi:hypothetical protein